MQREFRQVDVFTTEPYRGNPVAVVLDSAGLDTAQMQQVANWMNLSETTFVLPPEDGQADYRVRIFTPSGELPFAGHPTLGTCHAWLGAGGTPAQDDRIVQQCAAGLVPLRRTAAGLAFGAPELLRSGPVEEPLLDRLAAELGLSRAAIADASWADNGPGWVALLLASADEVLALRPGAVSADVGVAGPYPAGSPEAIEVRAFIPLNGGTGEDPVTGSLNAALAQWLLGNGLLSAPYVASQGTVLGRRGRVHIDQDDSGAFWVVGGTVTCIAGEIDI
jgi:PhzF family phenazine biosynthesis protein